MQKRSDMDGAQPEYLVFLKAEYLCVTMSAQRSSLLDYVAL